MSERVESKCFPLQGSALLEFILMLLDFHVFVNAEIKTKFAHKKFSILGRIKVTSRIF